MVKDTNAPDSLPEVDIEYLPESPSQGIKCSKCGEVPRIASNDAGVQAYCGPCQYDWPISRAIPQPYNIQPTAERGIRKTTLVEPDTDIAFENIDPDEEFEYEDTRRRRTGKRKGGD